MAEINRRTFLTSAAAATAALTSQRTLRAAAANDTVVLAIMGVNGRGSQLANGFAKQTGVEIAYICDCDERVIQKGVEAATSQGGRKPKVIKDFRRALDDPAVDALVCAAPNHWHAPATILACLAGKHVYVEKPVSHTPDEGERMIAAARQAKRVVQVGLQRRSNPLYRKAVERLRDGCDWQGALREVVVLCESSDDWPRPANRSAGWSRLRPVAGPCASATVSRQYDSLQLAFFLALGQRRARQQRCAHDRRLPLGVGSRLSVEGCGERQ